MNINPLDIGACLLLALAAVGFMLPPPAGIKDRRVTRGVLPPVICGKCGKTFHPPGRSR